MNNNNNHGTTKTKVPISYEEMVEKARLQKRYSLKNQVSLMYKSIFYAIIVAFLSYYTYGWDNRSNSSSFTTLLSSSFHHVLKVISYAFIYLLIVTLYSLYDSIYRPPTSIGETLWMLVSNNDWIQTLFEKQSKKTTSATTTTAAAKPTSKTTSTVLSSAVKPSPAAYVPGSRKKLGKTPSSSHNNIIDNSNIKTREDVDTFLKDYEKSGQQKTLQQPSWTDSSAAPPTSSSIGNFTQFSSANNFGLSMAPSSMHHPVSQNINTSTSGAYDFGNSVSSMFNDLNSSRMQSPQSYQVMPRRIDFASSGKHKTKTADSTGDSRYASLMSAPPDTQAAYNVLRDLGIESQLPDYVDNTRRMIGNTLCAFIKAFDTNVSELLSLNSPILSEKILNRISNNNNHHHPVVVVNHTTMALNEFLSTYQNEAFFQSKVRGQQVIVAGGQQQLVPVNLLQEQLGFIKYISVTGTTTTTTTAEDDNNTDGAVLQRVRNELVNNGDDCFLSRYCWDKKLKKSRGEFVQSSSLQNNTLPVTDAEVIMNVFCAIMDGMLPTGGGGHNNVADRPFKRLYFTKKITSLKRDVIFQSEVDTKNAYPHFKLILDGKVVETLPGRNNVFHTIILFLEFIGRRRSGHLENFNIHEVLDQVFIN